MSIRQKNLFPILVLLVTFLLAGCSKTSVTGSWKKSDYNGKPFTSIMVVGLTGDPNNKMLWETVMADRLRTGNVPEVTTTISSFPNDRNIEADEIVNLATEKGIQGLLVTRLVDTRKEEVYYPPSGGYGYPGSFGYYSHFGSYYPHAYARSYRPGYTATRTKVLLETNLYDVKTQELIWSMSSDTFDPRSVNQLADSVSKKVLATLKKDKLL